MSKVADLLAAYSDAVTRLDAEALIAHFDIPLVVLHDDVTEAYLGRDQLISRIREILDAFGRAGVTSSNFTLLGITPSGEKSAVAQVRVHFTSGNHGSFFHDEHFVLRFRDEKALIAAIINPRGSQSLVDLLRGTGGGEAVEVGVLAEGE